jgi:hypothetical protein
MSLARYERVNISKPGPGFVRENPAVREGTRDDGLEGLEVGFTSSQATIRDAPIRISSRLEDR